MRISKRYEIRTILLGQPMPDDGFEQFKVIEIVNIQPDRLQFRALVEVTTYEFELEDEVEAALDAELDSALLAAQDAIGVGAEEEE